MFKLKGTGFFCFVNVLGGFGFGFVFCFTKCPVSDYRYNQQFIYYNGQEYINIKY